MANKHAHRHRPLKTAKHKHKWEEKPTSTVPPNVQTALMKAMQIENVKVGYEDFLWIMAQESGGVVNATNHASTARGLFQLLRAQYGLNPNGEKSFGNAVEECQGGIHYIMGRYHSAHAAQEFWKNHHWY